MRSPSPPTTPYPALGTAILDALSACGVRPPSSSLPRGSGLSASRCPAPARDERPSGVGASAPFGAAISSAPCRAYVGKRNRCSRSASGMSSLDVGRERRLSFVGSVHCAGKTVLVMREMLPAGRSTNRDTPHQPSEPGAEAIPAKWERRSRRTYRPPPHGTRGSTGGAGYQARTPGNIRNPATKKGGERFPGMQDAALAGGLFAYRRETGRRRGGFCVASSFHPP